jgi:hypothetical protein
MLLGDVRRFVLCTQKAEEKESESALSSDLV